MNKKKFIFPGLTAILLMGTVGCTTTWHDTIETPEIVLDDVLASGTYSTFDIGVMGTAKGAIPMFGTYGYNEFERETRTILLANRATLDALSRQPDADTLVGVRVNGTIETESTLNWISGERTIAGLGEITVSGMPVRRIVNDHPSSP